jgi:hypothetical protein
MEAVTSSTLKKTPVLLFQEKVKSVFVGTLQNKKPSSMGQIFELSYEAGDVPTGISTGQKDDKGRVIYEEYAVKPGDAVSLFGNTQLDDKIGLQLQIGQRLVIVYKGLTPNPKTKRKFNDYFVGKLDPNEAVDVEALKK